MKRETRTVTIPRWLRPRLSAEARRLLAIVQLQTLRDLDLGLATVSTLHDLVRDAFTWAKAAELVGAGEVELRTHLEVVTSLVEHYGATGRVECSSRAQAAALRLGTAYMEDLAELVDRGQAEAAARHSEAIVDQLLAAEAAAKAA